MIFVGLASYRSIAVVRTGREADGVPGFSTLTFPLLADEAMQWMPEDGRHRLPRSHGRMHFLLPVATFRLRLVRFCRNSQKSLVFGAHRCGPAEFCIIEVCWRTRSWNCNETPRCLVRVQTAICIDATSDQPLAFYQSN